MESVRFYELSHTPIEKVLPQLLYKAYDKLEKSTLLLLENQDQITLYNKLLWTFSSNKFLPHGTKDDSETHYTPLLLTTDEDNLNNAETLVSTKIPANANFSDDFKQQIYVFSQNDNKSFLDNYHQLKENNIATSYYQQDAQGKWLEA